MQEKICYVAHGELDQLVRQVVDSYKDETCYFDIVEGVRGENLDRINRSILEGAEIIIAGGANAEVVRGYFKVSVINYKVIILDYMQAVQIGFREGKRVCLASYVTHMNSRLREYLGQVQWPVMEIIYEDTEELKEKTWQSEADVLVGNGLAVQLANSPERKGVILYYGKNSIEESIEEARRLLREIRRDRERNQSVKAMMEYSPNGVLYLGTENRTIDCNGTVYELLHKPSGILEGKIIEDVLPECVPENREGPESMVVQVDNRTYTKRWILVDDGNGNHFSYIIILALFSDYKKVELDYRNKQSEQRKRRGSTTKSILSDIIGDSYHMKMAKDETKLLVRSDISMLIYGETGVGKKLFAQSIYNGSLRKNGALVTMNCAALSENLLGSELSGHDEGAFTGSRKGGKKGPLELMEGGSLFLDEIGEISPALQAWLLRVLQEKEIMHVGGDRVIPINVCVVTVTNKDLEHMQDSGFRRDLLYCLNILELYILPLKAYEDDVIKSFDFYCNKKRKLESWDTVLTEDTKRTLTSHSWRGNIRELQNVCERFCLYMECSTKLNEGYAKRCIIKAIDEKKLVQDLQEKYGDKNKRELIKEIKRLFSYNNDQVGQLLGISRTASWRTLKDEKQAVID